MAGNILLISPELLAVAGLLSRDSVRKAIVPPNGKVNFQEAAQCRERLLPAAFHNFISKKKLYKDFVAFCDRESFWLNDFALFVSLKHHFKNKPWYDWPYPFKSRDNNALARFKLANDEAIQYIKWQQFIFFEQANQLKSYAHSSGVQLFGDLPFYISFDSADVWSHPGIFNISNTGKMTGIAGVPPDYFNSNGQLWGMPTFRWNVLKRKNYRWWIQRIRKNMELYDLLRLDHFRAFADYWEVPTNHTTAIHGKWKVGPGEHFFQVLKKYFPALPFVAEDLGDINDTVYRLRDTFNLPGMKVLQFAFGNTMPVSDYIPHNYTQNFVVYTGTHDNNTTLGWFKKNITVSERRQIGQYLGKKVDNTNISLELSRLAYASIAKTVILPLQDILSLDERARMNVPASTKGNWSWRFNTGSLTDEIAARLGNWTLLYNRAS